MKPAYCVKDGNCDGCEVGEPREGGIDCRKNEVKFCDCCGKVLGTNDERCAKCWSHRHPSLCWFCGAIIGHGEGCHECQEYRKELNYNY